MKQYDAYDQKIDAHKVLLEGWGASLKQVVKHGGLAIDGQMIMN
jgi:hypothetical protein